MDDRRYSGHHKVTEEEDDHGILGKEEIWRMKCGQTDRRQDTSTAGGRWRWQHKTELDGDKWSVDYVPPGVTRHVKSSQRQINKSNWGGGWGVEHPKHTLIRVSVDASLSQDLT